GGSKEAQREGSMERPNPQKKPGKDGSEARPARAFGVREAIEREMVIGAMGARGDAIAAGEEHPIYAPFTLPGERVRARVLGERAELLEVLSPSPERQAPACKHFGRCGGCQLQHWQEAPYLAWKRQRVVEALSKRGLNIDVEP